MISYENRSDICDEIIQPLFPIYFADFMTGNKAIKAFIADSRPLLSNYY